MSAHDIALLAHILLFCYWLGTDFGVFYSIKFVVNPDVGREARMVAAKIMVTCDLSPRICMTLMLTSAGILSHYFGVEHPLWQMIGIILLGPVWLTMVLVLHFNHSSSYIPLLTKIDFYFRWVVIIGGIISCLYALQVGRLDDAPWIAAKLLAFYFMVFCGLMIRVGLKGFGQTYARIIADKYNDEDNQIMINSLKKVTPWVYAIWAALVFEAVIGITKPGSPEDNLIAEHTDIRTTIQEPVQWQQTVADRKWSAYMDMRTKYL